MVAQAEAALAQLDATLATPSSRRHSTASSP